MSFACISSPDFMVQSVVRAEPVLRGGALASPSRALALISGNPPLWSVVAANAAAVQAGVQLGMTKAQVAEFCTVEIVIARKRKRKPRTRLYWMWDGVSLRAWKTPPRIPLFWISWGSRLYWNRRKHRLVNWQSALLVLV